MQAGAGNQARQPYVIPLKDGTAFVGFWEQKSTQSGGKVRVELDTPWKPGQRKTISLSNVVSATQERPTATLNRIQMGRSYRAASGGGVADGAGGADGFLVRRLTERVARASRPWLGSPLKRLTRRIADHGRDGHATFHTRAHKRQFGCGLAAFGGGSLGLRFSSR
jgi:hypothetical protein